MASLTDVYKSSTLKGNSCMASLDISSMQDVPENYIWYEDMDPPHISANENDIIPVIDFQGLRRQEEEENIIEQIGSACKKWGFMQIINHGISEKLLENVSIQGRRLFSLPLEQKLKAKRAPDGVTGYGEARISPFFSKLMWSEGFTCVGSPVEDAKKLWPEDHQNFCEIIEEYEHAMKNLVKRMMSLIGRSLGLSTGDFMRRCRIQDDSYGKALQTGALQMNYYPPCPQPLRTMGLAPHTDSACLTLLYQGEVAGLQIQHRGEWVTVPVIPNALIVNIGDLMQILSNGRYKSRLHRAVANRSRSRLSIAYLWGPPPRDVIMPVPQLVDSKHPLLYKSLTWNEYLVAKSLHFDQALQLFSYNTSFSSDGNLSF